MKEFIEKLIERFEEYKDSHLIEHNLERLKHCKEVGHRACDGADCFLCVWDKAKEIVNEFSKEYSKTPTPNHLIPIDTQQYIEELERRINNNDFCEWKFDTTGNVWNCKGCETYNLPYAMNLRIIADDFECKCPWCGKKIKVVE